MFSDIFRKIHGNIHSLDFPAIASDCQRVTPSVHHMVSFLLNSCREFSGMIISANPLPNPSIFCTFETHKSKMRKVTLWRNASGYHITKKEKNSMGKNHHVFHMAKSTINFINGTTANTNLPLSAALTARSKSSMALVQDADRLASAETRRDEPGENPWDFRMGQWEFQNYGP